MASEELINFFVIDIKKINQKIKGIKRQHKEKIIFLSIHCF